MIDVSVIVTTYNRPEALSLVLCSLIHQNTGVKFEIMVADDGSKEETRSVIQRIQKECPVPIHHVWQEDKGFRAALARNRAVAESQGGYLIFIDGDCVVPVNFLARHWALREGGYFVAGNRILLDASLTHVLENGKFPSPMRWTALQHIRMRLRGHINRLLPLIYIPFYPRKRALKKWQGAKTCNLGLYREDFLKVNGFDEAFEGWGFEDSDLVLRLIGQGIYRKEGRFASVVYHLYHPENDRHHQETNWQRFRENCDAHLLKKK